MSGPHYDDEEIAIMRRWFGKITCEEIVKLMPPANRRTARGVKEWCYRAGLRSELHRKRHTRSLTDEFYEQVLADHAREKMVVNAMNYGVPTGTFASWVARGKARLYCRRVTMRPPSRLESIPTL